MRRPSGVHAGEWFISAPNVRGVSMSRAQSYTAMWVCPLSIFPRIIARRVPIRRELRMAPDCGCGSKGSGLSVACHPLDREVHVRGLFRQVDCRAICGKSELSSTGVGTVRNVLDDRPSRASHLQRHVIERRSKQRPVVHVDEMAARHVSTEASAALKDLARSVRHRLNDDVGIGVVVRAVVRGVQDCSCAWKHLGPSVRDFVV